MQLWKYDINAEIGDEDLEIVSEIESSKITKSKFSLPITSK